MLLHTMPSYMEGERSKPEQTSLTQFPFYQPGRGHFGDLVLLTFLAVRFIFYQKESVLPHHTAESIVAPCIVPLVIDFAATVPSAACL